MLFDANSIKKGGDWFVEILPGSHNVVIESTWSNKFVDSNAFSFIAEAGKKYIIGLYELEPGQDPALADFHEKGIASQMAHGALEGIAEGIPGG